MTNRKYVRSLLPGAFLMMFCGNAFGQNVGAVQNLESTSHDSPLRPFQETRICMAWDYPEGEPYGYYARFDQNPDHVIDDDSDDHRTIFLDMNTRDVCLTMTDPGEPDDVAFYFHIAAVDSETDLGPAATAGPFRIDVVPPSDVGVTGPETTSVRTVTMTLRAAGASKVYISNTENDYSRSYESFAESKIWTLSEGGGEKTVYVSFIDDAFNETAASVTVTYITGDADGDGLIGLRDAVMVLRILSGMAVEDVNPDADVNADGKIGIPEAAHILRMIAGTGF